MRGSIFSGLNRGSVEHALRTTVVAAGALAIARLFGLPQPQWAAISAMVVTQSSLGAALTISGQRFAGTVMGAGAGALLATFVGSGVVVFAAGILGLGALCAALGMDRAAYRFAGITLAIVLPVAHAEPAWEIAAHRFLEVSLGILAGLAMSALWPERSRA